MSEHTPGPWRVSGSRYIKRDFSGIGLADDSGQMIASVPGGQTSGPFFIESNEECDANARRIVACVNACEGVPTELLEAYPAPFSELRAERDRLLVAMKKLVGRADDPNIGWRGHSENKDEFTCEYCRAASLDSTKIQHGPDCPVPQVLSAIAEVKGEPA